ncbi:MAG: hypothetical protein ACYCW6_23700 [Candidatus Xenobia bacterium]
MFVQLCSVGVSTGLLVGGGWPGAATGAAAGFVVNHLWILVFSRMQGPEHFVRAVNRVVRQAIQNHTRGSQTRMAVQNTTEGLIVGTFMGLSLGWQMGCDIGRGLAGGLLDLVDGVMRGIVCGVKRCRSEWLGVAPTIDGREQRRRW